MGRLAISDDDDDEDDDDDDDDCYYYDVDYDDWWKTVVAHPGKWWLDITCVWWLVTVVWGLVMNTMHVYNGNANNMFCP